MNHIGSGILLRYNGPIYSSLSKLSPYDPKLFLCVQKCDLLNLIFFFSLVCNSAVCMQIGKRVGVMQKLQSEKVRRMSKKDFMMFSWVLIH